MLVGFDLEDRESFSLPSDTGEPKTLFWLRPIPRGKLDELHAKQHDYMQEEKVSGEVVRRGKEFNREVVRWGLDRHEGFQTASGKPIPCEKVAAVCASKDFSVLSDATLDVYERTKIRKAYLTEAEDGPPGPDGAPSWKAGADILAAVDGPTGSDGEPKWRKGERIPYEVTLLDVLSDRVWAGQVLSASDRRALPGAGVGSD